MDHIRRTERGDGHGELDLERPEDKDHFGPEVERR